MLDICVKSDCELKEKEKDNCNNLSMHANPCFKLEILSINI